MTAWSPAGASSPRGNALRTAPSRLNAETDGSPCPGDYRSACWQGIWRSLVQLGASARPNFSHG
eukprot:263376-Alexandrium_andersonii.AAC.1